MTNKVEFVYVDTSDERTRMQLYFPTPTAATFDAILGPSGTVDDVRVALNALTLMNEVQVTQNVLVHAGTATKPNNASAQREWGAKLYYLDTSNNRIGTIFIGGIDPAFMPSGTDEIDLTLTEWAALVTAIEAGCKSRDGNPVVVKKAIATGRRN